MSKTDDKQRKALLNHRRLVIEKIIRLADRQRALLNDLDETEANLGISRYYDNGWTEPKRKK